MSSNITRLGSVAEVLSGYAFKSEWFQNSGTSVIRIGDIFNKEVNVSTCVCVDEQNYKIPESCRAKEGDILMALSGATTGKIGIVRATLHGALVNQRVAIIRSSEPTTQQYIQYLFNGRLLERLLGNAWGAAQENLSPKALKELEIPLPPLAEQRRIAAILDRADAVRRKRQQAIALTEELLRSAFLEMFGDPATNPKGWEVRQLDQFAEIQSGIAKGKKVDSLKAVSIPYMRVANVQDGYLNLTEVKEIEILPTDIDRYSLKQGDLLLTEGGDPDKLGRGAVWYGNVQPCIHQNHIFCVRPDRTVAEPEYLSSLIGSEYGKRYFLKAAKQTTGIATINKTQLRLFPAFLPPLHLQQKYTQLVLSIRSMMKNVENVNGQTETLFNSLLQRAFRGEL